MSVVSLWGDVGGNGLPREIRRRAVGEKAYSVPAVTSRFCPDTDFNVIGPQVWSWGGAGERACRGGLSPAAFRGSGSLRSTSGDQKPSGSKKPTAPGLMMLLKTG
jgi:hypothetical protein